MLLPKSLSHLPIQIRTTTGSLVKATPPPCTSTPKLRLVDQASLMEPKHPEEQKEAEEKNEEKDHKKRKSEELSEVEETPGTSNDTPRLHKNLKKLADMLRTRATESPDQAEEEQTGEREAASSTDCAQDKVYVGQDSDKNCHINPESDVDPHEDESNSSKQCSQDTKDFKKLELKRQVDHNTAHCDVDADEHTGNTQQCDATEKVHKPSVSVDYCQNAYDCQKHSISGKKSQLTQQHCSCCGSRNHLNQYCHESSTNHVVNCLENDEEQLFGRYVAAAIRKMNNKARSLAKIRIQQVLFHLDEPELENKEDWKRKKQRIHELAFRGAK